MVCVNHVPRNRCYYDQTYHVPHFMSAVKKIECQGHSRNGHRHIWKHDVDRRYRTDQHKTWWHTVLVTCLHMLWGRRMVLFRFVKFVWNIVPFKLCGSRNKVGCIILTLVHQQHQRLTHVPSANQRLKEKLHDISRVKRHPIQTKEPVSEQILRGVRGHCDVEPM